MNSSFTILVLSYKNHALDEFLNDVINQYPDMPVYREHRYLPYRSSYTHGLQPGDLIRTGKSEFESLQKFSERSTPYERDAQQHLMKIISVQRKARNLVKLWSECARSIENKTFFEVSYHE